MQKAGRAQASAHTDTAARGAVGRVHCLFPGLPHSTWLQPQGLCTGFSFSKSQSHVRSLFSSQLQVSAHCYPYRGSLATF